MKMKAPDSSKMLLIAGPVEGRQNPSRVTKVSL
jgi:hypothetical protein